MLIYLQCSGNQEDVQRTKMVIKTVIICTPIATTSLRRTAANKHRLMLCADVPAGGAAGG